MPPAVDLTPAGKRDEHVLRGRVHVVLGEQFAEFRRSDSALAALNTAHLGPVAAEDICRIIEFEPVLLAVVPDHAADELTLDVQRVQDLLPFILVVLPGHCVERLKE
jgi:hypothetical protein